jgi:hypothetical protein
MAISETLLPLGQIVATPGALEALARAGQEAKLFLERHASGDWGSGGGTRPCRKGLQRRPWLSDIEHLPHGGRRHPLDNNGGRPVFHVSASSRRLLATHGTCHPLSSFKIVIPRNNLHFVRLRELLTAHRTAARGNHLSVRFARSLLESVGYVRW